MYTKASKIALRPVCRTETGTLLTAGATLRTGSPVLCCETEEACGTRLREFRGWVGLRGTVRVDKVRTDIQMWKAWQEAAALAWCHQVFVVYEVAQRWT